LFQKGCRSLNHSLQIAVNRQRMSLVSTLKRSQAILVHGSDLTSQLASRFAKRFEFFRSAVLGSARCHARKLINAREVAAELKHI
jgi:hypothetical protein